MRKQPLMHYLDYNATAPILPSLSKKMAEIGMDYFGNPSSPHGKGREARDLLEASRNRIASLLGVTPPELLFTSGGSEGNNTILRQFYLNPEPQHLIVSAIEHPSVLNTCQLLERLPHVDVSYLSVTPEGRVEPDTLKAAIRPETRLISIMTANNETGVIQPIQELTQVAQAHAIPFHTDCVQGVGKIPVDWTAWGVQYATATAHKFGGPRGAGLVYIQANAPFHGLITGGAQERERRAGTENVMSAACFAEALAYALEAQATLSQKLIQFKKQIIAALDSIKGAFVNGVLDQCLPNTLNFGVTGVSAESLLISLDLDQICVSTGSACSSGALDPSHVLLAMGLNKPEAKSCLRVSMGWNTQQADVDYFIQRLVHHVERIQQKKKK